MRQTNRLKLAALLLAALFCLALASCGGGQGTAGTPENVEEAAAGTEADETSEYTIQSRFPGKLFRQAAFSVARRRK